MVDRRGAVRGAFLLVTAALTLAACANGPGPASPVPTPVSADFPGPPSAVEVTPPAQARVNGEEASIEFDAASQRALEDAQIETRTGEPTLGPLPGWTDGRDTVHLPISDGEVVLAPRPPRGRVQTHGALMMSRQGTSVDFDDLDVDLDASQVKGTADGRPITVFVLDLSRAHVEDLPSLPPTIVDVSGTMTDDARREIRDKVGVDLPPDRTRVDIELRLRPE